jgi:hypothetical protein
LKIPFLYLRLLIFSSLLLSRLLLADDREITDPSYKFTFVLPDTWDKSDMKETSDKDAISYSFERKDKKCAIMLLAFKLNTVKNLEDFIYTMEKDVSLNIPKKTGDYASFDSESFDGKSGSYKDAQYTETIYYYRTKLPDAPNNYVYMLRFITMNQYVNSDLDGQIKKIADTFLPTAR